MGTGKFESWNSYWIGSYKVYSSLYQRKEKGGRTAIIANSIKYDTENITNSLIQVLWGVEATPQNTSQFSKVQKIACCSLYSPPNSRKKSLLLDHISDAFNVLSKKYTKGLHFIIAGDTNDLKHESILNLSPNLKWTQSMVI